MALLKRTELGVKNIGHNVAVPNDPRAKLMYYLSCMTTVLDLNDDPDLYRLINYNAYFISEDEKTRLLTLCFLLSPEILLNKCIFQDDEMCGDSENKFYEISAVSKQLLLTNSILIGGQQRAVHRIMTFKMSWLERYWSEPIKALLREPRAPSIHREPNYIMQPPSGPSDGCCDCCGCTCSIL
ncbi:hypothetical protein ACJMK2_004866 [Sinanodonta woodiana]|uniref:Uncharacterized protein n=1 Tax=Sinanodonta woodiana TaxID=1069815 RepID=A0ABD3VNB8_SINWO